MVEVVVEVVIEVVILCWRLFEVVVLLCSFIDDDVHFVGVVTCGSRCRYIYYVGIGRGSDPFLFHCRL